MVRSRGPLAAIVLAVLVASCGGSRPDVTLSIGGEPVPTRLASMTEGTPCSSMHGDAVPAALPATIVRGPLPVVIRIETEPGFQIRAWIHDVDGLAVSGGPIEEFTVTSGADYRSRTLVARQTYEVTVNLARSVFGFRTEVTHRGRIRVETP